MRDGESRFYGSASQTRSWGKLGRLWVEEAVLIDGESETVSEQRKRRRQEKRRRKNKKSSKIMPPTSASSTGLANQWRKQKLAADLLDSLSALVWPARAVRDRGASKIEQGVS